MTDSEQVLALDLVLVMGIARTKGVMGLVGLGSILEYLEIVMMETVILIKILIAIVTIAGKAKVMIDTLIKVFIVAVTITLQRPRFQRFYILLQNAFCDAK